MLWPASLLARYRIGATDGEIGRVRDFFLDERQWGVRALAVDAGGLVLISPRLVAAVDPARRVLHTGLTTSQVSSSPRADTAKSARSAREMTEHYVQGLDREIGRVCDLLLEEGVWTIRHLAVAVEDHRVERRVLIPVGWVSWVSWDTGSVVVALKSDQLAGVPEYDRSRPLGAEDESRLVASYGPGPFRSR